MTATSTLILNRFSAGRAWSDLTCVYLDGLNVGAVSLRHIDLSVVSGGRELKPAHETQPLT